VFYKIFKLKGAKTF